MTDAAAELVRRAKALPREDRERLVDELLASLNEPAIGTLDAAWTPEVERRLSAFDRGEIVAEDLEVVLERAKAEAR